jgi:TolB-like protein/DNA-binding winged helix-turn-helix (wHTH) protein/Tfp pilus assembly protein PilF
MDNSSLSQATVLGFGVFELDRRAGELRKSGVLVHLPPQPFRVLALMASHPGQVVTREEIRRQIWDDETFVDFEQGLNHCIRQVRTALGDDAESPRYIETLPRRGYRFNYPVTVACALADSSPIDAVASALRRADRALPYRFVTLAAAVVVLIVAAVVALNVDGLRNRLLGRATVPPKIDSIAVLPVENLSGDPSQEYFAEGMTEELITTLGQISALRVISKTSVMRYKGTREPLPEIGRELNVDAVLEAAVLRSGDRIRITAQLIDARADCHLWAQTYERDLGNVLSLQDNVARDIASQIKIKLTPHENAQLAQSRPLNREAYEAYVRGRNEYSRWSRQGSVRAAEYFYKAVEKDPDYALAYGWLAMSYNAFVVFESLPPAQAYSRARKAASKALEIDSNVVEAHLALAWIRFAFDWDWSASEREFQDALVANPGSSMAHWLYAWFLTCMGREDEARSQIRRALDSDPFNPSVNTCFGEELELWRRPSDAIQQYRKTLDRVGEFPGPYHLMATVYARQGRYDEAVAAERQSCVLSGREPREIQSLQKAYASSGGKGYWNWRLHRLREHTRQTGKDPSVGLALVYAQLGEKETAFEWLEKAYVEHAAGLTTLKVHPAWDPLRDDARFQDLVRRMNFPPQTGNAKPSP